MNVQYLMNSLLSLLMLWTIFSFLKQAVRMKKKGKDIIDEAQFLMNSFSLLMLWDKFFFLFLETVGSYEEEMKRYYLLMKAQYLMNPFSLSLLMLWTLFSFE